MGDKAWKRLERDVAKYFGTQRRVRGADFGESDIEILATFKDWLGEPFRSDIGLAVECKYRKSHPIIDIVHENCTNVTFSMVRIGEYILFPLEDAEIFNDHILDQWPNLDTHILSFNIKVLDKKVPKYLDEYRSQAVQYTAHDNMALLPLVCMAQANTKGKVLAVHIQDIISFKKSSDALKAKTIQDQARVSETNNKQGTR